MRLFKPTQLFLLMLVWQSWSAGADTQIPKVICPNDTPVKASIQHIVKPELATSQHIGAVWTNNTNSAVRLGYLELIYSSEGNKEFDLKTWNQVPSDARVQK